MKLTIERAALLKSLGHVQSVVERRTTIPILSNVRLDAQGGGLGLAATDMDLSIVERTAAEVGEPGSITAPAHLLYEVVRKLPEGSSVAIEAQQGGAELTLRAGRSTFNLPTLPAEDFPTLGEDGIEHRFAIPAGQLRRLIDKTRFAISTEETRYYLNGVYLHAFENGDTPMLRAVATDGHRLARVEMPLPEGAAGMPGVIVPRKTVAEVYKLLEQADGTVEVSLSDSKIRFSAGATVLTSKLIDGAFPDYQRVIPADNDKTMEVDAKVFAEAVDRVSTISSEKSRAVKLSLDKDRLVLSATSPENGSAVEETAASYPGPAIEIGFNSRYLLDIAGQIEGDSAQFRLADAASPTLIRDVGDESALYVLMPMRV